MKLSPRHFPMAEAGIELSAAVVKIVEKYQLSHAELVSLLAQQITSWSKFQIRDERTEPDAARAQTWQEAAELMDDYDLLSTSGQHAFRDELNKRAQE